MCHFLIEKYKRPEIFYEFGLCLILVGIRLAKIGKRVSILTGSNSN